MSEKKPRRPVDQRIREDQETAKAFFKSFSSERLLQQAIAGLLERMPDTSEVQILQGAQELGKDIVFKVSGGFGEPMMCACVIKNVKITGDAGKSEGARTVFSQAQQCFDTPHIDANGKAIYIDRVYIITPFDLSPMTVASVKGRLERQSGQVVFISGPKLFDLFKEYWPDYLADEAVAIERHLRDTIKGFDESNPLVGIATDFDIGRPTTISKKVYVPQFFFLRLHSYELGNLLTSPLPPLTFLDVDLSQKTFAEIKHRFSKFEAALQYLKEWHLYLRPKNKPDEDLHEAFGRFVDELYTEWVRVVVSDYEDKEDAAARREKPPKEFRRVEPEKRETHYAWLLDKMSKPLRNHERFKVSYRKLQALAKESTALTVSAVESLNKILETPLPDGMSLLSEPQFSSYSNTNHCAYAAPDSLFEIRGQFRFTYPKNLIDKTSGPMLIVGAAGFGKTSFCRWNSLQDAARFNSGKGTIIPVYVPLHRLARRPITSFEDAFLGTLGKSALVQDLGNQPAHQRIRLYLDGLDEIPSTVRRKQIVDLARRGTKGKKKYQVIITARDHIYGPYLNWLPRLSLGGFDQEDVRVLIDQWLGKKSESRRIFYEQLKTSPSLSNLMQIPLLATLTILVFRQTGKLPENRTRLYQVFVELLSGGWDIAKRVLRESKYGQVFKLRILQEIASNLHEKRRREFGNEEVIAALQSTFSKSYLADWETVRNELIEDGLVSMSASVLQFAHLSFQEFLTAKDYIGDPQAKGIARALEAFILGDGWWREVSRFYVGLSANPADIADWLVHKLQYLIGVHKSRVVNANVRHVLYGVSEFFPDYPVERALRAVDTKEEAISFDEFRRKQGHPV